MDERAQVFSASLFAHAASFAESRRRDARKASRVRTTRRDERRSTWRPPVRDDLENEAWEFFAPPADRAASRAASRDARCARVIR